MVPTNTAIAKVRTSHSRVPSGSFRLWRLWLDDALCFLLYSTNACRMNEYITNKVQAVSYSKLPKLKQQWSSTA